LRKVRAHPQIHNDILVNLSKGAIVHYQINRIAFSTLTVPANSRVLVKDQLFYGRVPKIILMCIVDSESLSSSYTKSPFNFKHYNISSMDIRIDGVSKLILPLMPNLKR